MKKMIAMLLALAMAISLCACRSGDTSDPSSNTSGGTQAPETATDEGGSGAETPEEDDYHVLRVGSTVAITGFYPVGGGAMTYACVYESIVRRTADGEFVPLCIESYEWTDSTSLHIRCRQDVYFSDGDQMLPEDIEYAFQRCAVDADSMNASQFQLINFDETEYDDDGWGMTFHFVSEYGPFESVLNTVFVDNKSVTENWERDDERYWDAPVSTGPYEVVENVDGSHTTLKLREDYWDKDNMPYFDEIIYYYYSSSSAMFIAFENNEIDLVLNVDANDAQRLIEGNVANPDTTAYAICAMNAPLLFTMSNYKEELQDIKVREAIAHVLDPESCGIVQYGPLYSAELDSIIPSQVKYHESQGVYELDVEYAKQCMAESNYPNGFDMNVVAMETDSAIWDVVQGSLAQIGINLTMTYYDFNTCISTWMQENGTDAMLMTVKGGNNSLDPYEELQFIAPDAMFPAGRILDEEYAVKNDESVLTTDENQRAEAYAWMQQYCYENFQAIPVIDTSACYAYNTDVLSCTLFSCDSGLLVYDCQAPQG